MTTPQDIAATGSAAEIPAATLAHPEQVVAAHARVLAGSPARSRYVELGRGRRIHAIEVGEGKPLVLIHGSGPSALLFLPLMERFMDIRAIAVDRPGFGLSDFADPSANSYRDAAVGTMDAILDALELNETSLLGNSMGGTWAVWYALAHPDRLRRLVLLGAPPTLPGTRVPPPMLAVAGPPSDEPPPKMPPPSAETVVQSMAVMGEADTIVRYPDQIEARVAAGHDQLAANASLTELRATIAPQGWQPTLEMREDELRKLAVPTLLIWGDHDPLGGADVAQRMASTIPGTRVELLSAGHTPWLGHPAAAASLVSDFLR
jgi:pimeloyl-ACP methyl ester carboxylesterase